MKKVVSLVLVFVLLAAMFTVSFSASLSITDPAVIPYQEALQNYQDETGEELETQRVYFQMPDGNRGGVALQDVKITKEVVDPETGEISYVEEVVIPEGGKAPSWYNDFNIVDGQNRAGVYWYGGSANCEDAAYGGIGWVGYKMGILDYEQGIFYVDLPLDTPVTIFNNGVNGGMDPSDPIYYEAAQTPDVNVEGAWEGDYESLPYGSPDNDTFDGCIYIIDPNQVDINAYSNKQTCGGNWYVYYGDGCYGEDYAPGGDNNDYPDGTDNWSEDVADMCKNPDHWVDGVHVGYHVDEPTEAPATEAPPTEAPPTEAPPTEAPTEAPFTPDPTKLYFDTDGTGWDMQTGDKVGFYVFPLSPDVAPAYSGWGGKKLQGKLVEGSDTIWEYDPSNFLLEDGVQYKIIFTHNRKNAPIEQTYDLIMDTTCLGDVGYCDGTEYENPVDSSKQTMAAFWKGKDASVYGPVKQITSIGNVIGTCFEEGKTAQSVFYDFLTVGGETGATGLENCRIYVVEPGTKTEQQLIDDIGTDLGLTKQDVYDAFNQAEVETVWDYTVSTLPGEITHIHTPGEPVQENYVPATCQHAGGYDMVTYCTSCGEELSREHVDIGKLLHTEGDPVQENIVPATCQQAGGYDTVVYCTECGEEISRVHTDIGKLLHTPSDPVQENYTPATCQHAGGYDMVTYCTECGEELSREHTDIGKLLHTTEFVPEVPATTEADGVKAHYQCTSCHQNFWDEAGTQPASDADLRIPKIVPVEGILGDVDNDGEVTVIDVTYIQRIEADIYQADAGMIARGDVDKDGEITIIDATYIQRYLVELDDHLGIGGPVAKG